MHRMQRLRPSGTSAGRETVVTEEEVELRYVETGERAEAFTVASVYVVRDGRVVRLAPQSDFEAAARGWIDGDR
jgi:hypothetical protein